MEKKRTRAQDAAKGLMIIAVVFFHCYLLVAPNPTAAVMNFNILAAFFPFLLSTFFFYTGYNYLPNGRSVKDNILRRAKQLLIPLVVCFVISIVIIGGFELIYNHSDIAASFKSIGNTILYSLMSEPLSIMIGFPKEGGLLYELVVALGLVWFLYTLFICSIFFYILVPHTNKKVTTLISVDIICLAVSFCLGQFVGTYLPYCVQAYPLILAIMLTAAHLRQHHFLNLRILSKKDSLFHAINMFVAEGIIVGTCLLFHYRFGAILTGSIPGSMFDPVLKGFDAPIAFVFSIVGTYFIHTLCRLIKHIPLVGKALQWVGNHSALYYLFHPVFIAILSILIFQKKVIWGIGQAFFYVGITVTLIAGVGLLIDFILKKKNFKSETIEEIENAKAPEDI